MSTERNAALLIVNPASRNGAGDGLDSGIRLLEQSGLSVLQVRSESAAHVAELIRENRGRIDRVIMAGGDGTVSCAIGTLQEEGLPLGIVPLGTANDLARSLDIPQDIEQACEVIAADRRRSIDLATVNGRYFVNAAHMGLGVKVSGELNPELKKRWGVLSYMMALRTAFPKSGKFRARVSVDGVEQHLRSIQLTVGNGRFYGGGNIVEENNTIDNGRLCLYSLAPQQFWELLTQLPLVRIGKQRQASRVFQTNGHRIEIEADRSMEVHADGEPAARTPVVFEVHPGALDVFVPAAE